MPVAGREFHLGYSPERIDPGNPEFGLVNTPKVVSGIDATSLRRDRRLLRQLVDRTVPVSSTRVAEMTKLLENTFRHVNIALVNELAMYAGQLGVSVWEAIDAASTKPFGFMRFTPGPGVGGHCLPVDPSYLSWKVKQTLGDSFRIVELANDINEHMPAYVTRRVVETLNRHRRSINGSRIVMLGLAYKKNTGDLRESSPRICAALAARVPTSRSSTASCLHTRSPCGRGSSSPTRSSMPPTSSWSSPTTTMSTTTSTSQRARGASSTRAGACRPARPWSISTCAAVAVVGGGRRASIAHSGLLM